MRVEVWSWVIWAVHSIQTEASLTHVYGWNNTAVDGKCLTKEVLVVFAWCHNGSSTPVLSGPRCNKAELVLIWGGKVIGQAPTVLTHADNGVWSQHRQVSLHVVFFFLPFAAHSSASIDPSRKDNRHIDSRGQQLAGFTHQFRRTLRRPRSTRSVLTDERPTGLWGRPLFRVYNVAQFISENGKGC